MALAQIFNPFIVFFFYLLMVWLVFDDAKLAIFHETAKLSYLFFLFHIFFVPLHRYYK